MNLTDLGVLIPILKEYGLYTQKQFGQHFLINHKVLEAIVQAADVSDDEVVVEIGVGPGVLTRELAARAGVVKAYEIDGSLEALLRERTLAEFDTVDLTIADFLTVDPDDYIPEHGRFKVVANLPYNVGSHIIDRLLKQAVQPISITVLLQKEVAAKMVAEVPDGTYLSHFVAGYGQARIVQRVGRGDFFPAPKVESAVLHIAKDQEPLIAVEQMKEWSGFLHKGFSQPRKKLNKVFDSELLERVGIDPNLRAQHVTTEEWVRLLKASLELS